MAFARPSRRLRLLVAAFCAALLPLVSTSGATAQAAPRTHTWLVAVGQETTNGAIQGMAFLPGTVWINVGDKIVWTAMSGEIHTVTFLAKGQPLTPFNPFDHAQLLRQGGSRYDGHSYYNSGLLTDKSNSGFPAALKYSLIFDKTGTYTYWCLVHGSMMKGTVHVRRAGTRYPLTQTQYNQRSEETSEQILGDGLKLWHQTQLQATNHKVFLGADDGVAMVMRFINQTVHVRLGQKVTFTNTGMAAPHTVTFGREKPNFFAPYGDPKLFTGQQLNSGILPPHGSYTVTFQKRGTFHYICALHDYLGMVGTVVVS